MTQTIYRMTASNRGAAPIVSLHLDYDVVMRMQNNMEKAGWTVIVEWASVDWKRVVEV